ncbi:MAG: hypothetical protein ACRC42_00750 [Mycoplasma sp.]
MEKEIMDQEEFAQQNDIHLKNSDLIEETRFEIKENANDLIQFATSNKEKSSIDNFAEFNHTADLPTKNKKTSFWKRNKKQKQEKPSELPMPTSQLEIPPVELPQWLHEETAQPTIELEQPRPAFTTRLNTREFNFSSPNSFENNAYKVEANDAYDFSDFQSTTNNTYKTNQETPVNKLSKLGETDPEQKLFSFVQKRNNPYKSWFNSQIRINKNQDKIYSYKPNGKPNLFHDGNKNPINPTIRAMILEHFDIPEEFFIRFDACEYIYSPYGDERLIVRYIGPGLFQIINQLLDVTSQTQIGEQRIKVIRSTTIITRDLIQGLVSASNKNKEWKDSIFTYISH